MKTCVFAGSFDPFTVGHAHVVKCALEMFDKVVIALGENVDKKHLFSIEQRIEIIKECYKGEKRVEIATFSGMLVDFMKENAIKINVRGIRDIDDYKYETTMTRYNTDAYSDLITVYIPTPEELVHVSSTAMRNIIKLKGDLSKYVPKEAKGIMDKILNDNK